MHARTLRAACFLVAALLLTALTGCASVTSRHPVGQPLEPDQLEGLAGLDGVWVDVNGEMTTFHVKHVGEGELVLASLDWNEDEGRFEVSEVRASVALHHDRAILNMVNPDDEQQQGSYSFLQLAGVSQDTLVLYLPDAEAFAAAVEAGDLPGEVDRNNDGRVTAVRLTADKAALDAYLDADRLRLLFAHQSPLVYHRAADLEN